MSSFVLLLLFNTFAFSANEDRMRLRSQVADLSSENSHLSAQCAELEKVRDSNREKLVEMGRELKEANDQVSALLVLPLSPFHVNHFALLAAPRASSHFGTTERRDSCSKASRG